MGNDWYPTAANWPELLDEMIEAHLDTIQLIRTTNPTDEELMSHLAYLQGLTRCARATLAHASSSFNPRLPCTQGRGVLRARARGTQ